MVQGLDAGADARPRRDAGDGQRHCREAGPRPSSARLRFLMNHPEHVHARAQWLDRVWADHVFIEDRTVDVYVKRLREALATADCASMVETVRGAGYRPARPVEAGVGAA